MSVINKVLNQIEQREKPVQQHAKQPMDVLEIKEPNRLLKLLIGLLSLVIVLLGGWIINTQWFSNQPTVEPIVTTPNQKPMAAPQSAIKQQSKTPDIKPVERSSQVIENQIIAPKDVSSDMLSDSQTEQPLVPSNARVTEKSVINKPVVSVKPTPASENTNVAKLVKKKPASLSITPVELSTRELADLKYKQANKFQRQGKITKAKAAWREALNIEPSLHVAREKLAASYFGANETEMAISILNQGKKEFPDYEGYRVLMSQLYYSQDKLHKALTALEKPYTNQNASNEALAFAGSLSQQLKRWESSQQNYQMLVNRQPQNPTWVIGVAISLDAQGKQQLALKNYQQLIRLADVEKSLVAYANQRISTLTTQLNQER